MCQCEYIFVFLRLVLCSVVITGITSNSHNHVDAIQWDHAVDLNDDYRVLWNIVGQEITFEVQVRTLGYVGLGFSLDGKLPGSDVAIGWVSQGQAHFQVSNWKSRTKKSIFNFTFKSSRYSYILKHTWYLLCPLTLAHTCRCCPKWVDADMPIQQQSKTKQKNRISLYGKFIVAE